MSVAASHLIINTLTTRLFVAEDRRLAAILSKLNQRNKPLNDTKLDGFLHAGQFYMPKDASFISGQLAYRTPLHLSLHGDMECFLADRKCVEDEKKLISQVLFTLLVNCVSPQEVRDTLPECLIAHLSNDIAHLERTDEPSYTIKYNPRALRQYAKALPKIEFYSATPLLY